MKKITFIIICSFVTSLTFAQLNVSITANPFSLCSGYQSILTANVTGGTQPYSYLWSNSLTTSSITVYPTPSSDIYRVTVTDNNAASNSAQISLMVDSISIDSIHVIYFGDSATLQPFSFGGWPPFMWQWNNGLNTPSITVLATFTATYCVTLIDNIACWDSSCVSIVISLINDYAKDYSFSVFPNPATDKITLENKSNLQQDFLIKLKNVQGQELFNKSIILDKTFTLDVSGLDNGFYIMTLQNDKTYYKFKTIIQK